MENIAKEIEKEQSEIKSLDEVILQFDKAPDDPSLDEEIKYLQFNIDLLKREVDSHRSKAPETAGIVHFEEKESLNIKIKLIEEEHRSYTQQLFNALELIKQQIQFEANPSAQGDNELLEKGKALILNLQDQLAQARSELQRLQTEQSYMNNRIDEPEEVQMKTCSKCIVF